MSRDRNTGQAAGFTEFGFHNGPHLTHLGLEVADHTRGLLPEEIRGLRQLPVLVAVDGLQLRITVATCFF